MAAGKKTPASRRRREEIRIEGAREHNLKDIDVVLPRDKLVVITGMSGSGKSTLAFDILFAEGQRRFLDAMNPYARQYVAQLSAPDIDRISGLPPTVSIEQRVSRGGGKSTVATVTEVYQFVRLLFARIGIQYCPECETPVEPQTRDQLFERLRASAKERGPLELLAPVIRSRKGFHTEVAMMAERLGYERVRANGKYYPANSDFKLSRFGTHDVEVALGAFGPPSGRGDTTQARALVDAGLKIGKGFLYALDSRGELTAHSILRACGECGRSFPELDPNAFSYNSPKGWCPTCKGFGEVFDIPDADRGAREDAIEESWFRWREGEREICPDCEGSRLREESRFVRLPGSGLGIDAFSKLSVTQAFKAFSELSFEGRDAQIARDILPEVVERLRFLTIVGLDYLELGRAVTTLSGGESQRVRLASQLGSNLSGALYVLDEPTIGLHARDNDKLLDALERLRDRGNSLVVVEHDDATMRRADWIIDLGPQAGVHGGEVVGQGTFKEILKQPGSLTGQAFSRTVAYPTRGRRRPVKPKATEGFLHLEGAELHNLRNVQARFPLGRLVAVTGVSGSGKSSLALGCLAPAVRAAIAGDPVNPRLGLVSGHEGFDAVVEVDQSPIGRTPRSTPATYIGLFDDIRALFAKTTEAQARGYKPGRFSFNSPLGRCPECDGAGVLKIEMNFLPTSYVPCETCGQRRFNPETLDIRWNGKTIADVLDMTVEEALAFFDAQPRIRRALQALSDTGLDYLRLGQTSPTLSGGEAQRLKLVEPLLSGNPESARMRSGRLPKPRLFILEEPTIGLHAIDVARLVEAAQRLVDNGHSVIIIEHNLELIAEADWVIDLGPEGGAQGGQIIAQGTPEQITKRKRSHTGQYLKPILEGP